MLTTYLGDVQVLRALKAGATGYMLKTMLRTDLVKTIRAIHQGQRRIAPEIAKELAEHVIDDLLTEREIEILRRVATGTSNKIICIALVQKERTPACSEWHSEIRSKCHSVRRRRVHCPLKRTGKSASTK